MAEPLLLTGPPDALRADVSMENVTDQRVSVRGLLVRREGADDVAVRFAAILPPTSNTTVPLSIALPQTTPPGEYAAQLEIGGQAREAVLRVESKVSARLSPSRILAPPGASTVQLRLTNQGNVDIPLARTTRGRTDDGGDDLGPDVTLELAEPAVLVAGAGLELTATVTVPDGLDPTRRHEALVPVGVSDLAVVVLPRDDQLSGPDATTTPTAALTARSESRKPRPRKASAARPAARRTP